MVKFSTELEAQHIPEWKYAFVNYGQLQKHVKKIKLSRTPKHARESSCQFGRSIFGPIRLVVTKISEKFHNAKEKPEIIQVKLFFETLDEELNKVNNFYKTKETEFLERGEILKMLLDILKDLKQVLSDRTKEIKFLESGKIRKRQVDILKDLKQVLSDRRWKCLNNFYKTKETEFLERGQIPKRQHDILKDPKQVLSDRRRKCLNNFYKTKETEFLERGEIPKRQHDILKDLKQVLSDRRRKCLGSRSGSGFLSRSNSTSARNSDYSANQSEYCDSPIDPLLRVGVIAALETNRINFINSATRVKTKKGKPKMAMRIDIPTTTPTRTIAAVKSMLWEHLVNNPKKEGREYINRKKIQFAEKMIRGAFVELYRGLVLLKTYSALNMVAFVKILKQFDKVANQKASASYLKEVKKSHFTSSDKVVRLMDEVVTAFTEHFANNDRKKATKFLRPQQKKDSHMVTFFVEATLEEGKKNEFGILEKGLEPEALNLGIQRILVVIRSHLDF